jgi:hypothetical protein
VPPTRERPGLVPVLVHDRRRWYVVDPALTPDAAAEAVVELSRSAAPTNVGRARRVLRWTPLLVFALAVVGGLIALAAIDDALALTEDFGAAALRLVGGVAVLVGAIALTVSVTDRLAPHLDGPAPSVQVVPVPRHVLSWLGDDTPAEAVWRVTAAVGLLEELRSARWEILDVTRAETDEEESAEGDVDARAVAALLAAEAAAVDDLAAATGYVPSRRHAEVGR